jgi:YfiR/HmsC-like
MPLDRIHIRSRLSKLALSLWVAAVVSSSTEAQNTQPTHYQFIASYLYLFPQFTEWPKGTFTDESAPFVIGILGDDPFAKDEGIAKGTIKVKEGETAMAALLRHLGCGHGETIRIRVEGGARITRKLVIKHFPRPEEEVARCHLLFISSSEEMRLADVLKAVERGSVLTVGEMDKFTERQGIIKCGGRKTVSGPEKPRIEINDAAAKKRNLKLGSELLELAWKVN